MWEFIKSIFACFGVLLRAIWGAITLFVQLIGGWFTVALIAITIIIAIVVVRWFKNRRN